MFSSGRPPVDPHASARRELVAEISRHTGIQDPRLLGAFGSVPRHLFIPESERALSYLDRALPIGHDQTISQPSMIAIMLDKLELGPTDRVLEIGAGSGYAAALLAELSAEVFAIEIVPELAELSAARLAELGYRNVTVLAGNGRLGLPSRAPFDKILVSAGSHDPPDDLLAQLAPGGRIAIPLGDDSRQTLYVGERTQAGQLSWQESTPCMFVPLVGA